MGFEFFHPLGQGKEKIDEMTSYEVRGWGPERSRRAGRLKRSNLLLADPKVKEYSPPAVHCSLITYYFLLITYYPRGFGAAYYPSSSVSASPAFSASWRIRRTRWRRRRNCLLQLLSVFPLILNRFRASWRTLYL